MGKFKLRKLIRKIISENDIVFFHGFPSGYSKFPFLNNDTLPEELPGVDEVNKEIDEKTEEQEEYLETEEQTEQNIQKNDNKRNIKYTDNNSIRG